MLKTHYRHNGESECGTQSSHLTNHAHEVSCGRCKRKPGFQYAMMAFESAKAQAFTAQVPRRISEPWRDGNIVCECGNDTFRIGDRSCYGHYDNYHCAECGEIQSRLTETGMSF